MLGLHKCLDWKWSIDVPAGVFVESVCALVDVHTLDLDPVATRWNNSSSKKALLCDSIVSQSFLWIPSRNPKLKFSWV
ncbi:hypothetical protein Tco_1550931, partial [Tanacetum coccineum]